ncbi:MAG: tetratricopeptide repeat protein [Candidatus Kapabacteria bacterium]|nr:tetratricopeptide repeat protein [Candidatus Kapabacteria bacterium]
MRPKRILLLSSLFAIGFSSMASAENSYSYVGEAMDYRESVNLLDNKLIRPAEETIDRTIEDFSNRFSDDKTVLMLTEIDMYGKNYKVADRKLEYFIRNRSNSPFVPIAALLRGFMAFQTKDYKKADTLLDVAKNFAKRDFVQRRDSAYYQIAHNAVFWQAVSLFHLGKFSEAQPKFEECYRDFPNGEYADDAIFALGLSAEINKNYEVACSYYKTLAKKYPYSNNYVSAKIREANNYLILRDPTNAIFAVDNATTVLERIKNSSDDGKQYEVQTNVERAEEEATYLKAEAYNIAGKYSEAENQYLTFLEKYPDSDMIDYAEVGLGRVCIDMKKYEKAIYYFDEIINRDNYKTQKIVASAKLFRTIALKKSGKPEQAKKEISALAVQPDFPLLGDALFELGAINYENGEYENSIRNLQRAERESGEAQQIIKIKLMLGANYIEQRKWQQAQSEYKQAEQIAMKGNDLAIAKRKWYIAEARLKQGIALVNNSRYKEAIPTLQSFIGDNKDDKRVYEALFWISEAYYRSDMLSNAIETYKNLMRRFPESSREEEALYGLGWSYFRLKKFNESSKTFEQMIKKFPKSGFGLEVLARQGDGYYVTKQFTKAIDSYQKALKFDTESEEAQYCNYQMCHAYYKAGNYDVAVNKLLDFVKKYHSSAYADNALYLVGWIRFQQKSYAESIESFKYLLDAYPSSSLCVQAKYAIGDAYYNLERYEEAIAEYKSIVEKFPGNPLAAEALQSMQYCLESLGRIDEALRITDTFIAANPNSPFAEEFAFKKGEMFYSGKKFGDAVSEYENFLKEYPESEKSAEALYWMAKSYMSLNDTAKTVKCFEDVAKKFPDTEFAPLSLLENGEYQKSINQPFRAEELFEQLMRKYPKNDNAAQAGFEISGIRIAMGDTTKAIQVLYNVMENYQGNEYAEMSRYRIAMYYKLRNENDSALYHFDILSKNEYNLTIAAESMYRMGEIYMQEEKIDQALTAFLTIKEKFAGIEDWYSLSLLSLGECYEKKEQFVQAKDLYNALNTLRPDDEFGAEALRRLKLIETK